MKKRWNVRENPTCLGDISGGAKTEIKCLKEVWDTFVLWRSFFQRMKFSTIIWNHFFFIILKSNQSQLLGPFSVELKKHSKFYRTGSRSCDRTSTCSNSNDLRYNVCEVWAYWVIFAPCFVSALQRPTSKQPDTSRWYSFYYIVQPF